VAVCLFHQRLLMRLYDTAIILVYKNHSKSKSIQLFALVDPLRIHVNGLAEFVDLAVVFCIAYATFDPAHFNLQVPAKCKPNQ